MRSLNRFQPGYLVDRLLYDTPKVMRLTWARRPGHVRSLPHNEQPLAKRGQEILEPTCSRPLVQPLSVATRPLTFGLVWMSALSMFADLLAFGTATGTVLTHVQYGRISNWIRFRLTIGQTVECFSEPTKILSLQNIEGL